MQAAIQQTTHVLPDVSHDVSLQDTALSLVPDGKPEKEIGFVSRQKQILKRSRLRVLKRKKEKATNTSTKAGGAETAPIDGNLETESKKRKVHNARSALLNGNYSSSSDED